ncbi:MAG: histidinol-phosphatase [Chloroflexota bacterium]|nr:MAG: histidinol-phosphatase [Chloroflexota bacterium]
MNEPSLQSLLDFALETAWKAGRVTLGYFQTGVAVERKGDLSPVTRADREAEQVIRDLVERYWPAHGLLGEEFGEQTGASEWTWIIDPIDGTKSFVAGVPLYACLIALTRNREPVVGVAHFPALNETVFAARGLGCFWNGRRARVSDVSDLKDALVLGSDVLVSDEQQARWEQLCRNAGVARTWGDAYGYALVATGRGDVMVDAIMNVWDCGPFAVILEEAGGTFTDWQGTPTIYGGNSVATNGRLQKQVMDILLPAASPSRSNASGGERD